MNPKNRTLLIVGAVVVLVLGLAGIAVLVSGGDDDGDAGASGAPVPTFGPDVEEVRALEVDGAPVPTLDSEAAVDVGIGMAAPIVTGQSFDGTAITTGGPTDGPTMLVFLAHWCPHCNDEIPEILELDADGGVPDDLDIVGISTAVDPSAPNYPPSEWVVDKGWLWPVMADDADSSSFLFNGGSGFPYLMLLDADGTVLARDSGTKSAADLRTWIDDALSSAA